MLTKTNSTNPLVSHSDSLIDIKERVSDGTLQSADYARMG